MDREEVVDMSKLVLALRRYGSLGWGVTRRDGSVAYFDSPLDAVMDLAREADVLTFDLMDLGMDDVAVAHA
jgi:hypothetical protein